MKTRLIISLMIGVVAIGILAVMSESYLNASSFCENLGGKLVDYNTCQIVQPSDRGRCL